MHNAAAAPIGRINGQLICRRTDGSSWAVTTISISHDDGHRVHRPEQADEERRHEHAGSNPRETAHQAGNRGDSKRGHEGLIKQVHASGNCIGRSSRRVLQSGIYLLLNLAIMVCPNADSHIGSTYLDFP